MALTKGSQTTLDEWALTANTAIRLGTELDVSTAYSCKLDIKAALGTADISTGQPEIIIQTTGESSPTTEDWITYARVIGPATSVAPVLLALNATEPVGETVIACTSPATAFGNDGKFKFIKNTTAANSEIVYQVSDGASIITLLTGLANEQTAAASTLVDINHATTEVVMQWSFDINCTNVSRIRIIYNANYDADGPDVYCYSAYTLNTGL